MRSAAVISGRENITRAVECRGPEYVPFEPSVDLDWLWDREEERRARIRTLQAELPSDLRDDLNAAGPVRVTAEADGVRTWTDEWGTGWRDEGRGAKPRSHPLLDGIGAGAKPDIPDPYRKDRFAAVDEKLSTADDRYLLARVWFTLFERLWMLRGGFENALMDPYTDPQAWRSLRDGIVEYNLAIIDRWMERRVDGVFFSDNWGSQRGLLMDPEDWRRFYKLSYRRLFERVRSGGAHVWMHLCGNVTEIIPDLADIGLDVLNPVQPQAMDLCLLSDRFKGKLCFYGGVDVQGTLVRGTPDDVRREVRTLVRLFDGGPGGYVGGTSHSVMPETPLDNVIALYEEFLRLRDWT